MSDLIILPNGFRPEQAKETLTKDEVKLVTDFEAWCQRRGLAVDLLCKHCLDAGHGPGSRCRGDNRRDSQAWRITCAHADRVYGEA
jgi:hypothetical protein